MSDEFQDIPLICVDCEQPFVFDVGEQMFFKDKGFENQPKRCKPCRKINKERLEAQRQVKKVER